MKRLEGKVALVTGGGSGIGRATCERLASEGAHVVAVDVNDAGGAETVVSVKDAGGVCVYHHLDVTSETGWQVLIESIEAEQGRLDILVNNAGLYRRGFLDDMELDEFRRLFAVNVEGVFLGMKYAARLMRKSGGGSIINLSSGAGLIGSPGGIGYCGTKGAVRLMSKAAGVELPRYGIRVNSVHPGYVDTPMGASVIDAIGGDPDQRREQLTRAVPIRDWANPEDIANGIAFLASDDSRYMTGSELVIDGGATAQ
ncbi:MAG: SDR family NAD(P)-dependent oxidoreductase [Alphaproteobacteria bacterium]